MEKTYRTVRFFENPLYPKEVLQENLSLEDALEYCLDPETSSKTCTTAEGLALTAQYGPWFDAYEEE